ncbi:CaiB/BaiF CoA-transferase family protein [Variovorax sp. Sphag1AA]|uniref:CaiB/BaiF CoA transferase family protein n=1 Tax=Variovorax sp. Sphag1AA TaxID=2587027 RepID=UPI00160D7582|nr:CaiB/BaiF CoA-transferase family protein [Variovorax sp. Sphag1AA]MBB3181096.1 crotonobetainyl-CoA:carnitine CoA-transferase CaiB-like acyl-CoA transferase [Variovorax sp. Sphag1AA]
MNTKISSAQGAPLAGVRVVDFSTLLPGPMCSLLLANAGAEVLKIERPGRGDEMRSYVPKFGSGSVNFALLNQGKRSVALDLKEPTAVQQAVALVRQADVLIEQFRPGVMDRLGLGYEAMRAINPSLVYCAITGWGQYGQLAGMAAHDLNYQAETGLMGLTVGSDGAPGLPNVLVADLVGGAYPAMMNILLALRAREGSGQGCFIDIAMADNLFPLVYWGLGNGFAAGKWPIPGGDLVTGGTPRYQVYRTNDGRYLAAAPLEQKFWENFLRVLEAPHLLDDAADPGGIREAVAAIIATRSANEWLERFDGVDACVSVVKSLEEAVESPHFQQRGLFRERIASDDGSQMPSLPLPITRCLRHHAGDRAPDLGEANPDALQS